MSDKPNKPLGTCDKMEEPHPLNGWNRAATCENWKPLPTPPVDAPPASREIILDTVRSVLDQLKPENDCDSVLEKEAAETYIREILAPAAPPQDVQSAEFDEMAEAVLALYERCKSKYAVAGFLQEEFRHRSAAERPAPAQPKCRVCGKPANHFIEERSWCEACYMAAPATELGQHGRLLSDTESRAYVAQNADAALATPSPTQEDLELRERLAKSLWNLERNPGDAEWPKDATRQPYCKWAYAHADSLIAEFASLRRAAQAERPFVHYDVTRGNCEAPGHRELKGESHYYDEEFCINWKPLPAERVSAEELAKLAAKWRGWEFSSGIVGQEMRRIAQRCAYELEAILRPTHTPESGEGERGKGI